MFKWFVLLAVVAYASAQSAEHGVTAGSRGTSCKCGWANRNGKRWWYTRLVGGTFYNENEYPFIAGIARSNGRGGYSAFCGGSIITPNHVITAAHCTDKYMVDGTPIFVLLGTHDRSRPNSNAVVIQVSKISQPGRWDKIARKDDIALLTLSQSINFNNIIGPVCMPLPGLDVPGQTVRILGWGAEQFKDFMTSKPKKLDTTHLTAAACNKDWPRTVSANNPMHICTLSKNESACQGDSGGPVVWRDPQTNRYTLIGLVSFGPDCTDSRSTVHTKVVAHLNWINNEISQNRPASTCHKV